MLNGAVGMQGRAQPEELAGLRGNEFVSETFGMTGTTENEVHAKTFPTENLRCGENWQAFPDGALSYFRGGGHKLQAKLTLTDTSHSGEQVTITVDGDPHSPNSSRPGRVSPPTARLSMSIPQRRPATGVRWRQNPPHFCQRKVSKKASLGGIILL